MKSCEKPMASRSDLVRERLEQLIVEGEFANGERLDEIKLSQRFNVSRTPLREAFQALAASGLLDLQPRRGAFARHPAFAEVIEMFEVMEELVKYTLRTRDVAPYLTGRYSERKETAQKLEERMALKRVR